MYVCFFFLEVEVYLYIIFVLRKKYIFLIKLNLRFKLQLEVYEFIRGICLILLDIVKWVIMVVGDDYKQYFILLSICYVVCIYFFFFMNFYSKFVRLVLFLFYSEVN